MTVADTTLGTLVANLGYDKLMMPKPVFIGDTLRATSEVIELRVRNRAPKPGSSPGATGCSTSATSWCASVCGRRWC